MLHDGNFGCLQKTFILSDRLSRFSDLLEVHPEARAALGQLCFPIQRQWLCRLAVASEIVLAVRLAGRSRWIRVDCRGGWARYRMNSPHRWSVGGESPTQYSWTALVLFGWQSTRNAVRKQFRIDRCQLSCYRGSEQLLSPSVHR